VDRKEKEFPGVCREKKRDVDEKKAIKGKEGSFLKS